MPLVWWRLSSRKERVKVEKPKVWRRRILSCLEEDFEEGLVRNFLEEEEI